ncbi:hypothetical protein [uncultured Brevundimonas sp.]|uniref:hypothetical protein n=1 Tax=uncultured Brevundimonas sp. TaxID=213418 RepID=UPI0030EDEE63|tara:strand:- start:289 stop:918 length:630 start_codon:yes stop_codon:yes gene_type:complete
MNISAPTSTLALMLALGLTACGPGGEAPAEAPAAPILADPAPAPATDPADPAGAGVTAILLEGNGFMPANPGGGGTGLKLSFGAPRDTVISYMTGLHDGTAPTLDGNDECGAGPLKFARWDDDFTLAFQNGKFVGWWAGERAPAGFSTVHDIHVGSTLAEVRAAWPGVEVINDTVGPEFATTDIFGILTGTTASARVTALWAGVSCIFR